jgi:hypothetical protein
MKIARAAFIFLMFAGVAIAGEPIEATLGTIADGYKVNMEVNGVAITSITGGRAQATRLFSTDHPKKEKTDPKEYYHFCLSPGRNSIKIQYEQIDPKRATPLLQFYLKSFAYGDVFNFKPENKKSGTIEAVFEIYDKMPEGYTTQQLEKKP